jgi:hypothetical protein
MQDNNPQELLGGTFLINLRSDSVTGTILGSTASVVLPNSTFRAVDFIFNTGLIVTPGTTYYFDITKQSGDNSWTANAYLYNYGNGTLFLNGLPDSSGNDLWFREGIIVPESSSAALLLLGGGLAVWRHRKKIVE